MENDIPEQTENASHPETAEEEITSDKQSPEPETPKKKFPLLIVALMIWVIGGSGVVYFFTKPKPPAETPEIAIEPTPVPLYLEIDNLNQPITLVNGEAIISGKTLPYATVMVYSQIDEISLESDKDGEFETTILVGEEGGVVEITAFSDSGEEKVKTLDLTGNDYEEHKVLGKTDKIPPGQTKKEDVAVNNSSNKPEKTDDKPIPPGLAKKEPKIATAEAQRIKEKKVKDFLGEKPITPKPEKLGANKIKNVLSLESTESGEIANLKLKKKVVQLATSGATLKRHALSGVITAVSEAMITVAHQVHRDRIYTVYHNALTIFTIKGIENTSASSLEVGMRIAAVGAPLDDGLLAKRIHVIPGNAFGLINRYRIATSEGDLITETSSATPTATIYLEPSPIATVTSTPIIPPPID